MTEAVRRFLSYCFTERGLQTVYASYFTGNDASRRVMEKCGMRYHHFNEKELSYLGAERDLTYYAIERAEWAHNRIGRNIAAGRDGLFRFRKSQLRPI